MVTDNLRKLFMIAALSLANYSLVLGQADTTGFDKMTLKDLLNIKVTTASKTLQKLGTAPASIVVISSEQIATRGYQSLLDVIYDLPDMKVDDKIYPGSRNSITVRGTQGQQNFVILLNGIKISSATGEAMPIMENYPVHLASQVEILYGPASALYGADAVSGVINIITKTAGENNTLLADATATGGMYGHTNNTLFLSKKINSRISFTAAGQYYSDNQPDYTKIYSHDEQLSLQPYLTGTFNTVYGPVTPKTSFTKAYEAPAKAYNIYASMRLDDFTASFFTNYSKLPSSYGSNTSNTIYNREVFIAQSITAASASYHKIIDRFTTTTTLSTNKYLLSPKSNYRNVYTALEPAYKFATSSMVRGEEQVDYKLDDKLSFTGGAAFEDYYSIPQSADLEAPVNGKNYVSGTYAGTKAFYQPNGLPAQFYAIRYYNSASYLQAQYTSEKKLFATLGLRYDYNSRYGGSFNPRLGLVYKPDDVTTLKLFYGSAFLAPSPSTAYVQYGSLQTADSGRSYYSDFMHLPNEGLKPITSHNVEMNISHYINKNLSLSVSTYYTLLKGTLETGDDNHTTHIYNNVFNGIRANFIEVFINNGRQKNYGGNIQLNFKKSFSNSSINYYLSASYVNGLSENGLTERLETSKDKQLDFISPFMIKTGAEFTAGNFSCSPRLILMGRQHIWGIADSSAHVLKRQTIAGYALLNASLRYHVANNASVFVNITNALNQHYKATGFNMDLNSSNTDLFNSGQRQDPIRIMAGINYSL